MAVDVFLLIKPQQYLDMNPIDNPDQVSLKV